MYKQKLQVLSGLLALTLLSGCGGAEIQPESTSVNQAMLIEQSSQIQQEAYTFPSRFTGDWQTQEGRLTIHADAEVVAEQGVILPTATLTPRNFDQGDVDNLLEVFLKGAPLYENVLTKDDYRASIERVSDPNWQSDPDAPPKDRDELLAYYEKELENAPEEAPIIHGFSDSSDPENISGVATVDGVKWYVSIENRTEFGLEPEVWIRREEYRNGIQAAEADAAQTNQRDLPAEDEAIAQADALMEALGLTNMVCDDVQPASGTLMLRYVPTVDGFPLPSIREDYYTMDGYHGYQYWAYSASEETNPDTVSWHMESIQIYVDEEGICCFRWESPTSEPSVKAEQSALLPFEEIAAIADATLPLVVTGPTEGSSLVEVDRINGEETFLDVEITQVSLTLMRIRDKGSLQGTIVPVWDFWGTREWYDDDQEKVGSQIDYSVQPLLTLNAVDGSVVSRLLGY